MTPKQWLLLKVVALLLTLEEMKTPKVVRQKVCTMSTTGRGYMMELLQGSSMQMFDLFRMGKPAFLTLCEHFRETGLLRDSKHLDIKEKMAIFLMTISHKCSNRMIKHRFQHSGQTISKFFHEVLWAMMHFSQQMIVPPNFDEPMEEIRTYRRLRQGAFRGAIGALDGTLISASIPVDEQIPYRARGQGECFQNVMAVCDFDMKFVYVMAGWEGVVHDARVLNETLRDPENNFPVPPNPNMYYLCDLAYTHTRGFMCPYRNTQYWSRKFNFNTGNRVISKQEKFNYAHARLRNVIERSFGVLKARFPILSAMPSYDFPTQRNIVVACMTIHNFLRRVSLHDELFEKYECEVVVGNEDCDNAEDPEYPAFNPLGGRQEQADMVILRNQIADELEANAGI